MNICIIGGRVVRNATVKGTERKILRFTVETRDGHEEGENKERVNQVPCVLFNSTPELEQVLGSQGEGLRLEFMGRVLPHRSIAVVISDFITPENPGSIRSAGRDPAARPAGPLPLPVQTALRMANRRHDVVAVQITDRYELELPALGRLVFQDAETGEIVEVNTGDPRKRQSFAERQARTQTDLARLFRSAGIDAIRLRTDQPYAAELGRFFEARERRRLRG